MEKKRGFLAAPAVASSGMDGGVSIIDKIETQNPFIRQFGKQTF